MLDVERGALERLMHTTVFTTPCSPGLDVSLTFPAGHHVCFRPSKCRAVARTSARCSLRSTKVSNSARSASVKRPSVLRSMRYCNQSFTLGGKHRSLTASTPANGAATVVPIINSPRNMLTRRELPQCVACFGDASDLADE